MEIDMRSPLALMYAPQDGKLYNVLAAFEEAGFQYKAVEKCGALTDYSLQSTQNMCVCVIDLTSEYSDFEECFEAIDFDFRSAGGPVVVIGDNVSNDEENRLLSIGAAKVVDISLGAKALQLILSLEIREFSRITHLKKELLRRSSAIGQIVKGVFKFKTRREAQNLATMLSMTCPNPMPIAVGLAELLINGVEHGCLGIGHDEKGALIEAGLLADEVQKRRQMPEYAEKFVTVDFEREPNRLCFRIKDGGDGFDFVPYVSATGGHEKKHGRGIMMAKGCFEELEYLGNGNEVYAVHYFGDAEDLN